MTNQVNSDPRRNRPTIGRGEPRKEVERVVRGEVTVIKPKMTFFQKLKESILGDDDSVMSYVVYDILVPAAKDVINDMIARGAERMIFGDSVRPAPRIRDRRAGGIIPYDRMAQAPAKQPPSRRSRPRQINEVIIQTREEALDVVDRLQDFIDQYQVASVGDFYELVGILPEHVDYRWGWTNIASTRAVRAGSGWVLLLPEVDVID